MYFGCSTTKEDSSDLLKLDKITLSATSVVYDDLKYILRNKFHLLLLFLENYFNTIQNPCVST
jgi:hypothetical protein